MSDQKPSESHKEKATSSDEETIEEFAKRLGIGILPPDHRIYQNELRIVLGPSIERYMQTITEAQKEKEAPEARQTPREEPAVPTPPRKRRRKK